MANGDNLEGLASELLTHNAKDEDTQLLMKGMSMIVQSQRSLPCKDRGEQLEQVKKFQWKAMGAVAALIAAATILISLLAI